MSKHSDVEAKKRRSKKKATLKKKRKDSHEKIVIMFPNNFSLLDDYEKNIAFINSIINRINFKTSELCLDMSCVDIVDISALIYTDVIIKNIKRNHKIKKIYAYYPENTDIKNYLDKCGFAYKKDEDLENFKIIEKKKVDTDIIKEIIDYLNRKKAKINLSSQKALYSILLELMDNTEQHAYNESNFKENWYFYMDVEKEKISFVFLDNGRGIVNTIRLQSILLSLNSQKINITKELTDSTILKMALTGGFRLSSTRQRNRNRGLPDIHEKLDNNYIKNLKIISRKACYGVNENKDLFCELNGTLFYWEVDLI